MTSLPKSFPEASLYALLKALFGPPNGVMSKAIKPQGDPDAPFKYEYLLFLPDGTSISICRSWLNVEVRGFGRVIKQREIVLMLMYNLDLHKDKVAVSLDGLEVFRLVINPHARHLGMMRFFEKELKAVDSHEPQYPRSLICTKEEMRSFNKQVPAYLQNMQRQNTHAVSLIMESAYSAESLLNLFIAVLKKPLLSPNSSFLNDALHEKWRDKIERLPLHCDNITGRPDPEHPAVKAVDRVFKRRNRIAHSYPDPEDLCPAKIWFDGCIPILPNCGPYVPYQMGVDALLPRLSDALECPPIVTEFIEYMYSLLSPPVQSEMRLFCKMNPIGFSEKTGRFAVPFGENINMALFPKG